MSEILSFDAMNSLELSAFFIGSVTLIIFVFSFLISQFLFGDIDSGDVSDADIDYETDSTSGFLKYISFQSVFLGVSTLCWSFLAYRSLGLGNWSLLFSVITGFGFAYALYFVKQQIKKLNTPNNIPFFIMEPGMIGECISPLKPFSENNKNLEHIGMALFLDKNNRPKETSVINDSKENINVGSTVKVTKIEGPNIFIQKYSN